MESITDSSSEPSTIMGTRYQGRPNWYMGWWPSFSNYMPKEDSYGASDAYTQNLYRDPRLHRRHVDRHSEHDEDVYTWYEANRGRLGAATRFTGSSAGSTHGGNSMYW